MLFDTPLLNLSASTASPSTAAPSNKRKAADPPAVNLDKLLKKMGQEHKGGQQQPKPKKLKKDTGKDQGWPDKREPRLAREDGPQGPHGGRDKGRGGKGGKRDKQEKPEGKGKKGGRKQQQQRQQHSPSPSPSRSSSPAPAAPSAAPSPITLTPGMVLHPFAAPSQSVPSPSASSTVQGGGKKSGSVQDKLRAQLAGGKFRMLNETLYTTRGDEAYKLMKDDGAFDDYHIGFRSQAATWPVHPLALIAQTLLAFLPANSLIADFGCGDAALARSLNPLSSLSSSASSLPPIPSLKLPAKQVASKQLKVVSFDLVSQSSFVVEAECSSVPLPGGTSGGEIVDAVVCCLSLMGTDWIGMVREARRVLKEGGVLKIAEVTSRFPSIDDFVKLLVSLGFTLSHKDDSNSHFLLLDFTKTSNDEGEAGQSQQKRDENSRKAEKLLNPCIYKRR
ncbi:hypothetical protein JCM8547_003500 [Rhodosporidiobolus lusitaniae]